MTKALKKPIGNRQNAAHIVTLLSEVLFRVFDKCGIEPTKRLILREYYD